MMGWLAHLRVKTVLAAFLALAFCPVCAQAAWFGLRNDTAAPIMVKAVPGRPMLLLPGEISWENIPRPVVKVMVIVGAKPPRATLFQGRVPCGLANQYFSIRQTAPGRVLLIPARPPTPPPQR